MIRHIFLKDLRRLWPFVAGLALLHLALAVMRAGLGVFPEDHQTLRQLAEYAEILAALLVFFTAIMVVQLDPIPDDQQDWLVRPIRRRDLLAAKLAFVIVALLGPLFAASLLQGLMSGFPFGQALAAAASWSLYEFVNPVLPALAIAAISRGIGQALGLGLAIIGGVLVVAGSMIWGYGVVTETRLSTVDTLAAWLIGNLLVVVGAAAILRLQYFQRATLASRVLLGVFPLLLLATELLLPYSTALAMQNWLLPAPDIAIAFVPQARKPVTDTGAPRHANQPVRIALPLQVNGLPPGLMLLGDRVKATFTAPDGASAESEDNDMRLAGGKPFQQLLSVGQDFFRAHAGQKVRVELEYLVGVIRPHAVHQIAAKGGDLWLAEGAHCISRIDRAGTSVQLGCLQPGNNHARLSAELLEGSADLPGDWKIRHFPSDAPYSNSSYMMQPFTMDLKLRDPNANLPVVAITMSQPVTHVLRRVVISELVMQDWKVESTGQEGRDDDQDR